MTTTPKGEIFASKEEAVRKLSDFRKRFPFPRTDLDPASIALESAGSSLLSVSTRRQAGAAEAYLRWAGASVPKMAKSARYVINQGQFDILVRRTGQDLLRAWREASPDRSHRISYGTAFRIVDLLFKAIDESAICRCDSVRRFLHVPLDGATLKPLRLIVDGLLDADFAVEIPSTIPSGFIATEEQYSLFQGAISSLARLAGIPPILYAHWCARA
jgi:hypothetical protein